MALLVTGRTLEEMRGEEFEVAQRAGAVVSDRPCRLAAGTRHRARHRSQRGPHRAAADRQRSRSQRATDGRPGADRRSQAGLLHQASPTATIRSGSPSTTSRAGSRARAVRQSDNSYRFDFRHDVRFGGRPAAAAHPAAATDGQRDRGHRRPTHQRTRAARAARHRGGESYDFFAVARRRRADRGSVSRSAAGCSRACGCSARVDDRAVNVTLQVSAGPRVDLQFDGATPPARSSRKSARSGTAASSTRSASTTASTCCARG